MIIKQEVYDAIHNPPTDETVIYFDDSGATQIFFDGSDDRVIYFEEEE